jgi:hypothetical protein
LELRVPLVLQDLLVQQADLLVQLVLQVRLDRLDLLVPLARPDQLVLLAQLQDQQAQLELLDRQVLQVHKV